MTQNDCEDNNYQLFLLKMMMEVFYDISKQQRHIILSSVIEAGIMSRRQVIDLLEVNIKRKSTRPDCALAIQKWKEDIDFVNAYKTEDLPKVVFDKIVLKYRKTNNHINVQLSLFE